MEVPKAKVNFLVKHARPFLTNQSHEDLLDKEVFFVKEEFTKGYPILKQGVSNSYVYLILSGRVGVYTNTN